MERGVKNMSINYKQYLYLWYIKELEEFKQACLDSVDLKTISKIKKTIKKEEAILKIRISAMNEEDAEDAICSFNDFKNSQISKYYNVLGAYFQKAYSIFESQTQAIQEGYKIKVKPPHEYVDFSKYPIIDESNRMINVLKHRKGRSYNSLKESRSKFVDESEIFKSLKQSEYSTEVLNIEFNDIINFLSEAQRVWQDIFEASKLAQNKTTSQTDTAETIDDQTTTDTAEAITDEVATDTIEDTTAEPNIDPTPTNNSEQSSNTVLNETDTTLVECNIPSNDDRTK